MAGRIQKITINQKNIMLYKTNSTIARREVLMALKKVPNARVYSSFRDLKTQQTLVKEGKSQTLFSNHRRGLAVDVLNWRDVEKALRAVGLINDIDWDKNHFAWGGESQAAKHPIIDEQSRIPEFFPNPVKVKFIVNKSLNQSRIVEQICRLCSFYAESFFDLDWTLEVTDKEFPFFTESNKMRWIDWKYLMPFADNSAITCWIYNAYNWDGLINNTGKFKDFAIVQIPLTTALLNHKLFPGLYGDYLMAILAHEFCHGLNWLLTGSLEKDKLDSRVALKNTEEAKTEAVREELNELFKVYVSKQTLPKLADIIKALSNSLGNILNRSKSF